MKIEKIAIKRKKVKHCDEHFLVLFLYNSYCRNVRENVSNYIGGYIECKNVFYL